MADDAPTYRTFVTSFTDFLTVAVHTIIYERGIYPQTSFLSARKYNFAVRQSRHPKVCEWINDAVIAVENELLKSAVDRVAVVIYSKDNKPLERFMFDVSRFPIVPVAELDVPLQRLESDGSKASILPTVDMEEQFRATMSRLSNCATDLGKLPKGCTFTIAIELRGDGKAPVGHPQPWVPAEGKTRQDNETSKHHKQVTPVRSITAGDMVFETWIEELHNKGPALPSSIQSE
ncbi:DNA polymerase zeta processivity subunit [Fulvia fulva]|nr:DNA polymerase zeta processivity subunit [Fulvia fulva]WPV32740.1 DNA polymerase zeta processivity subunit [Fulvia fulva]